MNQPNERRKPDEDERRLREPEEPTPVTAPDQSPEQDPATEPADQPDPAADPRSPDPA